MKINVTIIPTDLVTNLLLRSFCPFLQTKKKEPNFQQFDSLVMRNISVFCLQRVALYFKAIQNSIDFYKGISLRVIPVCIIVPCSNSLLQKFSKKKIGIETSGKYYKSIIIL